jgi:hypothetical protein
MVFAPSGLVGATNSPLSFRRQASKRKRGLEKFGPDVNLKVAIRTFGLTSGPNIESKSQQSVDLHDKRAVEHWRESLLRRVAGIAVYDEHLGARTEFPPEARVCTKCSVGRTVLRERADKHMR